MGLPSLKFFCNPGTLPKTDKMLMGPPPRFVIYARDCEDILCNPFRFRSKMYWFIEV